MRARPPKIVCYAEGTGDRWEAYCLTFDLAVQGRSFDEVHQKIVDQVGLYLDGIGALPVQEQGHLLFRRAPWWVWLRFMVLRWFAGLLGRDGKEFTLPMPAKAA
jgi:hypothetical protein